MKKIIALLMTFALLFSHNIVWAAKVPSLDFLKQGVLDGEVEENGTLNIRLNEPFGLLELLAEDEFSNHIDIAMLIESFFDSTMSVSSKTKIANNGKKYLTEAHIKSNVPFKANGNLEGDIRTNQSSWMEFDFSDEENPYFDMITTHPFAAKYITANSEMLLQNDEAVFEELLGFYQMFFNSDSLAKLNNKAIESMERNATVTGTSKKVKISFTDMGLKLYLMDVIVSVLGEMDESLLADFDAEVVKKALSTVPVFGKEAMVMEYTLNSKGRITKEKTVLNVDFNIYDLVSALGSEVPSEETGITREKCSINFTVESQTSFKYDFVEIKKPALTEDNSIDIFEYYDLNYYDESEYSEEDYAEEYYSPWVDAKLDKNCFADGEVKSVQLRSFFENMGYSVSYDNGTIWAKTISKYAKYKEFCFVIGSDVVYADGNALDMHTPLFTKDGVSYISVADCENLTNFTKDSVYYYFETIEGHLEFVDREYMYGY